jgi:hypothetical protein
LWDGNIGDDVGSENASWVDDNAWPRRSPDELFDENKDVNQFIVSGGRKQLLLSRLCNFSKSRRSTRPANSNPTIIFLSCAQVQGHFETTYGARALNTTYFDNRQFGPKFLKSQFARLSRLARTSFPCLRQIIHPNKEIRQISVRNF